jgi:hypothetical protein
VQTSRNKSCFSEMTKLEFKKMKLPMRYNYLKSNGVHLASREFSGYFVHLFALHNFYVEVWMLIGLDQIRWIEIQENQSQIDLYVDKLDLGKLFD